MSLDIILISFTFMAGVIAYISSHMERTFQLQQNNTITNNRKFQFPLRKLVYGFLAGLVTTTGFITIFFAVGLGISYIGIRIAKLFPWIAFASAILVIGIGIAKLSGEGIYLNIPASKFFLMSKNGLKKSATIISFCLE